MVRHLSFLGGLVLWASPLFAQEYIDLEQERLRESTGSESTGSEYGQPSYPSSESYSDPAPDAGTESSYVTEQPPASSSAGELFYQLQLLQQEVMELRGQVEEQSHQLRQLKEQSLERYLDLDRRLKEGTGEGQSPDVTPGAQPVQALAGESDAYRAAYSLVRSQQFADAVVAFRQFLVDYPSGRYTANAHYWLGELYLVIAPPDDESARREFNLLLENFPTNSKVPDALYKLGKIYFDRGNRERCREYLERVINEYGDSGSSAVKLARDFLSENY